MIITLMFIALVGALAATASAVAVNNLQTSQLASAAGVAVNAADAGVAEGISYLRSNGVKSVACTSPQGFDLGSKACVASYTSGTRVSGQSYSVVIVTSAAYGTADAGRYVIYSTGVGTGTASRTVSAEVVVKSVGVAKGGFFGHAVSGSGNATANQSVFSTGCVYARTHITMSGIDSYGLPAAIHSAGIVTDDNGTAPTCTRSNKAIHDSGPCYYPANPVNGAFDQDSLGGALTTASNCYKARALFFPGIASATWDKYYATGTKINDAASLLALFGLKDPALSQAEIDDLKATAKAQGNYRTTASSSDVTYPNGTQAVMFYDLNNGRLDLGTIKGFVPPSDGTCLAKSLVVVVVGGDVVFPSGNTLSATVVVATPGKQYSATGGSLAGTVYADSISLGGNAIVDAQKQACYASNPSTSLLNFTISAYRELDN